MKPAPASAATRAAAAGVRPRAFTLELTKGCNLRCGYCYYAERDDAYQPRTKMTQVVAERSVDLLLAEGPEGEPVHLHFFGGEPLMNLPLLQHTVLYGERRAAECGKTITFEVTTNGTLFKEDVVAFLNEHRIHVGVSFDGPPEIQDEARPMKSGSSHAAALPGIHRLMESRRGTDLEPRTHCSVVVTRRDLDLTKIVLHLEELGFTKIILTPATDLTGKTHGVRVDDLPEVLAQYDRLADLYEERLRQGEPLAANWFPNLMGRLLSGERRTKPCQGGRDYLGVAANGDTYLCYRFYDDEEFRMGDVHDGLDRGVTERLMSLPMETRPACSTCWARYFCGGGCHHDNLISGGGLGDPNPVTCEILRHGMARVIDIWARLSKTEAVGSRAPVSREGMGSMSEKTTNDFTDTDRPRRADGCHSQQIADDERVVYEPESHEVVVLNATAQFIFDLADGDRTVADLLAALKDRYEAPEDVLRKDLLETLEHLRAKGILSPAQ